LDIFEMARLKRTQMSIDDRRGQQVFSTAPFSIGSNRQPRVNARSSMAAIASQRHGTGFRIGTTEELPEVPSCA